MKHVYFSALCIALYCLGFGVSNSLAQSAPVKLGEINYKNSAKAAWLQNLSIDVKNTSEKKIAFAEVRVSFSGKNAPADSGSIALRYGGLNSGAFTSAGKLVSPGTDFAVSLVQSECGSSKSEIALAKSGYVPASAGEIAAELGRVIFADGTAWTDGKFFEQDPNNPRRWLLSRANAASLNSGALFGNSAAAGVIPASLTEAKSADCGTYVGYEILTDCCPDLLVFSDIVDYDQPGSQTLRPISGQCPGSTIICTSYRVAICH